MSRYIAIPLTLLLLAHFGLAAAQDEATEKSKEAEKPSPFKSLKEEASYTIGQNLAAQIKFNEQLDLDFKIVIDGFQDALLNKEPKMTERQMQEAMVELGNRIRKAREEKEKMQFAEIIKEGTDFLEKNAKREGVKTTKSGLQYEILQKGDGKVSPKPTDTVTTHYHGTLLDGTVFDSSVDRGEPIDFPVNGVIKGWTEALQLMKVGDKFKLFIPSELAYGARGAGAKIKPHSTLVFEVELLDINGKK